MKITVSNEQEKQVIVNVCDAALKIAGIKLINEVVLMINSITKTDQPSQTETDNDRQRN